MIQKDIPMYIIFGLIFFSPVFWYISQDWRNENLFPGNITTTSFEEDYKNLGLLEQGDTITIVFLLKNTGTNPLIIKKLLSFCNSTTVTCNNEPVKTGKTGTITVTFIPILSGTFTQKIEVTCNTLQQYYYLRFSGTIKEYSDSHKTKENIYITQY